MAPAGRLVPLVAIEDPIFRSMECCSGATRNSFFNKGKKLASFFISRESSTYYSINSNKKNSTQNLILALFGHQRKKEKMHHSRVK